MDHLILPYMPIPPPPPRRPPKNRLSFINSKSNYSIPLDPSQQGSRASIKSTICHATEGLFGCFLTGAAVIALITMAYLVILCVDPLIALIHGIFEQAHRIPVMLTPRHRLLP